MYFLIRSDDRDSRPSVMDSAQTRKEIVGKFDALIRQEKESLKSLRADFVSIGRLAKAFELSDNGNGYVIDYFVKKADDLDSLTFEHPYA